MPRVLVIDDEDSVRSFCRDALQKHGYEVAEAADARLGIEMFRQRRADVVLMDVLMPRMDGAEATERLMHEFPGARVVAMSGGWKRHPEFFLCEARMAGARETIGKPFTAQELIEVIGRVLNGKTIKDRDG